MNKKDAFKILGLAGKVDKETIKTAYRKAMQKYHPDRNSAGLHMAQLINSAYEALKDFDGENTQTSEETIAYGDKLSDAINAIINFGLQIEVCGSWIWVSGDTKPHKDTLKENKFRWSPQKLCWYFRPEDYKSYAKGKWNLMQIREKYGSSFVERKQKFLGTND